MTTTTRRLRPSHGARWLARILAGETPDAIARESGSYSRTNVTDLVRSHAERAGVPVPPSCVRVRAPRPYPTSRA